MAGEPDEDGRLEAWERRTDYPLTALAVFYLVTYALQVLATRPGQSWWTWLDAVLWGVWALFVVDYVIRIGLANRRLRFVVRHPLDLLIVAAPFFRFLRLLRLVAAISTLGRVLRDDFRGRVGSYLLVSVSLLGFVAALGVFEAAFGPYRVYHLARGLTLNIGAEQTYLRGGPQLLQLYAAPKGAEQGLPATSEEYSYLVVSVEGIWAYLL